jgi:hypothetical protein
LRGSGKLAIIKVALQGKVIVRVPFRNKIQG